MQTSPAWTIEEPELFEIEAGRIRFAATQFVLWLVYAVSKDCTEREAF